MSDNQRHLSGIWAVCLVVLFLLQGIWMPSFGGNLSGVVEMLYLFPIFLIAHILAIVALCTRSKINRWLGLAALILFWGFVGVMKLIHS